MKQGFNNQMTNHRLGSERNPSASERPNQRGSTDQAFCPSSTASLSSGSNVPARTSTYNGLPATDPSVVQPAVSSIVLINGQSVSPAANSNCRWKIPFIQETIVGGSTPPPAIIAVTETWLKNYITDAQVSMKGYKVYRSDRDK